MTDPHFEGKTALVTGAGAGIGQASAKAFAARGARVMLCDIDKASAEETAQMIVAAGGIAEAAQCDATSFDEVERLVKGTVEVKHADGRVEVKEKQCALCRCGHSTNKPWCDGSHRKEGFVG